LRRWLPRLILLLILLAGGYFRTLNLADWDSGTGQHPDERFFSDVASTVRLPSDLSELYDSARSPLNPRSYDKFPLYVYGPFPIIATRLAAATLSPPEALPETVPSLYGPPQVGLDASRPNEARTNYGPQVPNPERSLLRLPLLGELLNPDGRNLTSYGEIQKVGRGLAALFDLGSVVLIYLIGRRLFGMRTGLLAAALAALTVMSIQQSHFFVDPIYSTFFCLLSLYWAVRAAQGGGWIAFALLGLSIGAAMANRITMATLGLVGIAAAVIAATRAVQHAGSRGGGDEGARKAVPLDGVVGRFVRCELPLLVLAGALTLLSFRALAPDAFIGSRAGSPLMTTTAGFLQGAGFLDLRPEPRFLQNLSSVRGLVSGDVDFPPSQQWVGRPAWIFPWTNMVLWGMGPALGLAAWAGLAAFALGGLRRLFWPRAEGPFLSAAWVPVVWIGFYFGWQGQQFAITLRYLLPIYGALTVFAAWGLVRAWEWGTREGRDAGTVRSLPTKSFHFPWLRRAIGLGMPILVLLVTLGWAYAFTRIYTQPHSRVMAARWFAEHAPAGSYVISEIWDDPLPLQATDAGWGVTYEGISSAPYAEDEPRKYFGGLNGQGGIDEGLLDQLDRADYITLTSNRVYDSTSRLRMRYPALMRYYNTLFSGELGFRLAAEITSYPSLLGVEIPDQSAEEAFHVYDHPRVLIFEKTPAYSRERAEALIAEPTVWSEVYKSPVIVAERNATALRLTKGQWPRYMEGGSWSDRFGGPLVSAMAPLLWLGVLQLLGLATFALLFRLLPRLPDRGYSLSKILGLLGVAYAAWLLGSLGTGAGVPGQGNLSGVGLGPLPLPFAGATLWLCAAPLLIVGSIVAWRSRTELAAFGRERRNALIGAEAIFLGFVLLGLLLRWLNPDLWHPARGGEKPMDLAYFTAVLKTSAFPPYDPWHAGGYINYYYFGFVLVGALAQLTTVAPSIAYNLAVATIMGLTALGAWGVVYNLLGDRGQGTGNREPGNARRDRRALEAAGLAPALLLLLGNLAQAFWFVSGYAGEQAAVGRLEWAYWDATRIVPGTVNEFPFFTFLFGDLHAHMLVMPLSLALLGLSVAYLHTLAASHGGSPLRAAVYILVMGLLAGAIRVTNTWDYPTFAGLAVVTMAVGGWRASRGRRPLRWTLLWMVAPPALMLLAGNLFFAPFTAQFATESSGIELWREGLAPTALEGMLLAQRTTVWDLLRLYGHWLIVTAIVGMALVARLAGARVALAGGLVLALVALAGAVLGWPALVLLLPLLLAGTGALWRLRRAPYALLLPAFWIVGAIGLAALVELVAVKGDIGRMNTVFKFGLHSWMLFAIGIAALLPRVWLLGSGQVAPTRRWAVRGILAVLAIAALIYPLTATPARAADRWVSEAPRSLDGNAYMAAVTAERHGQPFSLNEDAAAIDWLRQNVRGTPVILEAHLPSYQWAGRVATNTGLPTVLGWEWHQIQQRNVVGAGPVIGARQQTIGEIYNTPDTGTALERLRSFGVEYLYLGGVERASYDPAGLAKFEAMAAAGELERVFQQGQTAIYRVTEPGAPGMLTSDLPIVAPTAETFPPLLLDRPVGQLPVLDEYAWNALSAGNGWLALLLWLLAIYGLGALGLPLAWIVFGRWRDGGAAWARLIGLLLFGYAVWLPTSLGLWQYDRWGLLGGLALVLLLNVGLLWWVGQRTRNEGPRPKDAFRDRVGEAGDAQGDEPRSRVEEPPARRSSALGIGLASLVTHLRERRAGLLWSEGVFLAAFAVLAAIRALNPDLWHPVWGGEKPMEFGFLNAILRSPVMPPYDPFFSDGIINYYYYGLYLVSLPIKLTGIPPAMGFNLAVATIFALTLSGAFALGAQLTGRTRYGLLAAAMVGVLGNLAGFFAAGWSRGFGAVAQALRDGGLGGFGARLGDWFIGPSRVIPNTINEFPAFSFLFADLHPHLIALPITLLVAALGYRILETGFWGATGMAGRSQRAPGQSIASTPGSRIQYPVTLLLLALALGALAVTNSWDAPTYGLLVGLALLVAAWRAGGSRARGVPWLGLIGAGLTAVAVGVGGLALYAPFFDQYFAPVGGVGVVPWDGGTLVRDYLLIYGLFAAALLPALAGGLARLAGRPLPARSLASLGISGAPIAGGGLWAAGVAFLLLLGTFVPMLGLRFVLAALLLLTTILLLRRGLRAATCYALLLAWVAWAVSLGIELIYIRDHLDGGDWYRMNTVFKFGLQVWVLLAIAAVALLPALLRGLRRTGGEAAQRAGLALLAVFALLAAIYPLAGTPSRIANRFEVETGPTLDGLAFMDQASFSYDCAAFGGCQPGVSQVTVDLSGDAAAIGWLNETVAGTPVVVQSNRWFYRAYGIRIAANTGLPTVVSALHVNEQRDPQQAARRDRDVEEFYTTGDVETALRFLGRYRVSYVYVGGVERAFYPASGLAKFDLMRDTYLAPVYETAQVQIYQVSGLPPNYGRPEPYDFAAEATQPAAPPSGEALAGLAELEEANKADPTNGPLAFGLAERYRDLGRLAEAAAVLEPAARANPQDTGVLHLWGDILTRAGRYPEAEEAYLLAAQARPTVGNWNKLGAALLDWGELDKAEIALRQASAADLAAPEPYFQLGRLFAQRGEAAAAATELQRYLALAPDGPWAAEARALLDGLE
jgi:YYY domain-containing protein